VWGEAQPRYFHSFDGAPQARVVSSVNSDQMTNDERPMTNDQRPMTNDEQPMFVVRLSSFVISTSYCTLFHDEWAAL
jgi:hypothetical protein